MANVEIPLEKFTFITDKTILDELYAERSIEVLTTEEFLNLPPTEAYLNNTARIERVAREKAEREAADEIAALEASDPYSYLNPPVDTSFNEPIYTLRTTYAVEPDYLYTVDVSNSVALRYCAAKYSLSYDCIDCDDGNTDTEEKDYDIIENGAVAQ